MALRCRRGPAPGSIDASWMRCCTATIAPKHCERLTAYYAAAARSCSPIRCRPTTARRASSISGSSAANGRNPLPIVVPCHRVIGSNGTLTGFGGGLDSKRFLPTDIGRSMLIGLLAERWLFFAEAEHAVSLYYGHR